ncbi:MAG TPA: hypothetical protein VGS58_21525 [Candidatus Sulfopaludibacter sp.]|nr:hypothetical protein [Candidatus Sulfopaludibacter sp.]
MIQRIIQRIDNGYPRHCGEHMIFTPQISTQEVAEWRAAIRAFMEGKE